MELVSREIGVNVATLERWRADALSLPDGKRVWTAAARWEAIIATSAMDDAVWDHSTFTKNRNRLLEGEVARRLFAEVLGQAARPDSCPKNTSASTVP